MKRLALICRGLMIAALTGIPLLCWGNGFYEPGTVVVDNSEPDYTYMLGAYNVRFNPNVSDGQIMVSGSLAGPILIYGKDSSTGANFMCLSRVGEPAFATAKILLYGVGDGTKLDVAMQNAGSKCISIDITQTSSSLH